MKGLPAGAILSCAILMSSIPAFAQRDFLTSDEVEKVRDAQEPNDRLKLYVLFARQRIDQLQRLLDKQKKGRSLEARELLEDYGNIIDAVDTVSDDALRRGADITLARGVVREAETRFLTQLHKIQDKAPADLDLYEIELKEAIEGTSDSLDLGMQDAGARAAKLSSEDKKEKDEAERTIAAEDSKGKTTEQAKADEPKADDGKPKRKPPTLYRKGEQPNQPQ